MPELPPLTTINDLIGYCPDPAKDTHVLLGYLLPQGEQVFEPQLGAVPVFREDAEKHNKARSTFELKVMDDSTDADYADGPFYMTALEDKTSVVTWTGELVSSDVSVAGRLVTFSRNKRRYRGMLDPEGNSFCFVRIN